MNPMDFIRNAGIGMAPVPLQRWTPAEAELMPPGFFPPAQPAMLPENIPAPPGMFGMPGQATDAMAMNMLAFLESLGPINRNARGADRFGQALLRGLLGSMAGRRATEYGQRQKQGEENKAKNREAQRDYKAERQDWGRRGWEYRRERQRERAAEEADMRRQQREQENIRLRASLDQPDSKANPYKQGYDYRKGQLDAEAAADKARADAGLPPRKAPPKASYVPPVPASTKTKLSSMNSEARRVYGGQRDSVSAERTKIIETAIREAYKNAPDSSDPNAARYARDFNSFLNETGYRDKWRSVVGK